MPKPTTKLGTPHQVLKMSRAALLVSVALTGGLAGCAIGPNYQRAPMDRAQSDARRSLGGKPRPHQSRGSSG